MASTPAPTAGFAIVQEAEKLLAGIIRFLLQDHTEEIRQVTYAVTKACVFVYACGMCTRSYVERVKSHLWPSATGSDVLAEAEAAQPLPKPEELFAVIDCEESKPITVWTTENNAAADAEIRRPGWANSERYMMLTLREWEDLIQ